MSNTSELIDEKCGYVIASPQAFFALLETLRKDHPLPAHLEAEYLNYKLGYKKL